MSEMQNGGPDEQLVRQARDLLDQALLDADTRARLQHARQQAMAAAPRRRPAMALWGAGLATAALVLAVSPWPPWSTPATTGLAVNGPEPEYIEWLASNDQDMQLLEQLGELPATPAPEDPQLLENLELFENLDMLEGGDAPGQEVRDAS